jgi:hypothetical protein
VLRGAWTHSTVAPVIPRVTCSDQLTAHLNSGLDVPPAGITMTPPRVVPVCPSSLHLHMAAYLQCIGSTCMSGFLTLLHGGGILEVYWLHWYARVFYTFRRRWHTYSALVPLVCPGSLHFHTAAAYLHGTPDRIFSLGFVHSYTRAQGVYICVSTLYVSLFITGICVDLRTYILFVYPITRSFASISNAT